MKSTWGRRGMIMEKFGWTWDYVTWGIPFAIIQRIMSDLPWYDYQSGKADGSDKPKATKLTSDNVDQILAQFNSIPR